VYQICTTGLLFDHFWHFYSLCWSVTYVFSVRVCNSTPSSSTNPVYCIAYERESAADHGRVHPGSKVREDLPLWRTPFLNRASRLPPFPLSDRASMVFTANCSTANLELS